MSSWRSTRIGAWRIPMTSQLSMLAVPNEPRSANDIGIDLVLLQFGVQRGAADLEGFGSALDVATVLAKRVDKDLFFRLPKLIRLARPKLRQHGFASVIRRGKSGASMIDDLASTTACNTTFSNSRTFPGQCVATQHLDRVVA